MRKADEKHLNPDYVTYRGKFTEENRILHTNDPRSEYVEGIRTNVLHWGQRKLLLSEIEFLSDYGTLSDLIVYAGAAPGTHIPLLSDLFPLHRFHLYDTNPFNKKLKYIHKQKVETFSEYFNPGVEGYEHQLKRYKGKSFILVSDIRTAYHADQTEEEYAANLVKDNDLMMNWVLTLRPRASLLKFRFPFNDESSRLLAAERIYLPVWGPVKTTEVRLVPKFTTATYSHRKHEHQMHHFNTVTRIKFYPHDVVADGIDHCFDCRSEVFILEKYLRYTSGDDNIDAKRIGELSERISKRLGVKLSEYAHFEL